MNRKKFLKGLFFIIVSIIVVAAVYNIGVFLTRGKQQISVKTATTYYTGNDISATVSVKKVKKDKLIDAKVIAELYDDKEKKVKDVNYKTEIEKGESEDILLKIPEDLETGKYTLRITSKSGLLKDKTEIPINILKDVKSNVVISLDKGIYKPGDEINFRALVLSKKENTPVKNDVTISIYDGNENRVYTDKTKTSEYGIVSGKFKLADEVNSGTYKISVTTETQEVSKNFTVNPYITPKFEASISTDKENYLVGDVAQITVSGKYFFGEPVKEATIKGKIDGKNVTGITDVEGNFVTTYKIENAKKINMEFEVTDNSNYMIETNKTVTAGTNLFEIEAIPEYGFLAEGVNNEIYIITKKANGEPIKTYSTITLGRFKKEVISDASGIGKLVLTSDEIEDLVKSNQVSLNIISEDMEKNEIEKNIKLEINSNYKNLIKTDKVKYNQNDDIEISINSKYDTETKNIYVLKNGELLKTISTEDDSVIVNLKDASGLIDIVIPNGNSRNTYYDYSEYQNLGYYSNRISKRTVFIKPKEKLNIDIKTSKEEYKPGDNLEVSFNTTNEEGQKADAALLVSILDEAILSLAENDLSIDNIKLALEDIVLSDGISAADVYAMVLDDSSSTSLQTLLIKQPLNNLNIIDKKYVDYDTDENLALGIILLLVALVLSSLYAFSKSERIRKVALKLIIPTINVIAIFLLLALYLSDFIYDYVDVPDLMIFIIELVLAIIIYVLYLYKEQDLIFKMIKEFAIYPAIILMLAELLTEILNSLTSLRYSEASSMVTVIGILGYAILFTIFHVLNRRKALENNAKKIYEFLKSLVRTIIFLIAIGITAGIFDEYSIIIVIAAYVLYKKVIAKETKTKIEDGKIILNVNPSEILGMIIGFGFIVVVLLILGFYLSSNFAGSVVYDAEIKVPNGFDAMDMAPQSSSNSSGGLSFSEMEGSADSFISSSASDNSGSSSSANRFDFDFGFLSADMKSEDSLEVQENINIESDLSQAEKELETQENVRNIFLESLAFIPELVTNEGTANLDLKIGDNITTWSIQTVGNTKTGEVGYSNSSFKVFKEFFVDFSLPTNSVVTDNVNIPVTLYNYTENELAINLNVKENDWSKIGDYTKTVSVPAKSTNMIYLPLEIIKEGNNTLRIESSSGNLSDIVEKTMVVKPNGLEINQLVSSGIIDDNYTQDFVFNEDAIDGTKDVKIRLYASPLTQALENIEGMLQMPTGCFEQTSSSLYPDILILRYLRENDINDPKLEEMALDYISKGYQKILTYEVPGTPGGYSLYGNSPAEPVITAFGLMEINELSKVYEVDQKVIDEMIEYMFSVQKSNGTFDYSSTYIGGSASTDKVAMNAYITWALSEVCPEDKRLEKSIEYLEKEMEEEIDNYTLALMANAFINTNNKSLANEIMKELKAKIVTSDSGAYLQSTIRDYYGTRGRYQDVQTTALTSMALTKLNSNQKTNSEIIKYLHSVKDYRGTWGTTQSTILALKAITDYGANSDVKNQTIVVSLNGQEKKVEIGETALDVYEFDFENVGTENNFAIEMKKGKITYEIIKNYFKPYDKVEIGDKIIVSSQITNVAKVNDVIKQNIIIKNNSDYIENGLLEINIPQGCTVIEEALLTLKYNGTIEKYEYNYGKINIYLREVNKDEKIELEVQYRALYPEKITGAAVRMFDYYNPDVEGICIPTNIEITE